MRDVTKSSVRGGASSGRSGTRPTKTVPFGISLPIFSATRKRPVGVLKLPSSVPIPNRDVETGYVRIACSFSLRESCWSRIETWMLFIRTFLLVLCNRYGFTIATMSLGEFQGASEAPVSAATLAKGETRKFAQRTVARRVELKMARRQRCFSVAGRKGHAPSSRLGG